MEPAQHNRDATAPPTVRNFIRAVCRRYVDGYPHEIGTLALGVRSPTGPIQIEQLGKLDKWGGWTAEGTLSFTTRNEGFFGLSLYGKLVGCRVAWLAVSQT